MATADEGVLIPKSDLLRMEKMLLAYERGELTPSTVRPPRLQPAGRPDIVVMLLDVCNSGEQVQAAVLEDLTSNETQFVTSYGTPTTGYYRLGFRRARNSETEWTENIDVQKDDAEAIQLKLEALDSFAPGDVIVSGGIVFVDETRYVPNRVIITFGGRYAGVDVQLLEIDDQVEDADLVVEATSVLEDTGRVEWVREVLGVGVPTPIRAGARALCHWVHGIGYCLGSIEARDYGDYGLMKNPG
ncbi:MAG: hypothetical protein V4719_10050 [Planctomycetota bacterium]